MPYLRVLHPLPPFELLLLELAALDFAGLLSSNEPSAGGTCVNGRARCDELGDWAVMIITECARAIGKKGCKVSGGEPRLGGSWGCKSARVRMPRPAGS